MVRDKGRDGALEKIRGRVGRRRRLRRACFVIVVVVVVMMRLMRAMV